jgi:hypothetical protein
MAQQSTAYYNTSQITVAQTKEEELTPYEYYKETETYLKTHHWVMIGVGIGCFFLLTSIIYSFCKVPLKRGYRCRCCERTKWILKAFVYQIFFLFFIVEFLFRMLFKCLELCCPDTKTEDNKLSDEENQKKSKQSKFLELSEAK